MAAVVGVGLSEGVRGRARLVGEMRTYLLNREYVVDAGVELGVALEDVGVDTGQGAWGGREAVSEGRRSRPLSVMVCGSGMKVIVE